MKSHPGQSRLDRLISRVLRNTARGVATRAERKHCPGFLRVSRERLCRSVRDGLALVFGWRKTLGGRFPKRGRHLFRDWCLPFKT